MDKFKGFLAGAVFAAVACVLQIVGLIRYLQRLTDDWIGIGLYMATTIAFALAAHGFHAQWKRKSPVV